MSEERPAESTPSPEERQAPPGFLNGGGQADDVGDSAETSSPPPSWREDWRTALAQGDDKRARQLEKYATPEAVGKAFFDAQRRILSGRAVEPEPPDLATEDELKQWRQRAGIPETPEGYEVTLGETASDRDKTELAEYLKYANDKNMRPREVKQSVEWFMAARAEAAERAAQAGEEATLESLAELRKIYPGREYKRNIGLANDYLNAHFEGPDAQQALDVILAARLPNGVQLTNYAPFVQAIVAMARKAATEDDLIAGDTGGGARSVDDEFRELAQKPKLTDAEYQRMNQLAEARIKRQERQAAR